MFVTANSDFVTRGSELRSSESTHFNIFVTSFHYWTPSESTYLSDMKSFLEFNGYKNVTKRKFTAVTSWILLIIDL